jgi:hypothetical protein
MTNVTPLVPHCCPFSSSSLAGQRDFACACGVMIRRGVRLHELRAQWPQDAPSLFPITEEFPTALREVKRHFDPMDRRP